MLLMNVSQHENQNTKHKSKIGIDWFKDQYFIVSVPISNHQPYRNHGDLKNEHK